MQSEKNMQKCGKPPEKGPQGSGDLDPEPLEEFDNSHETNSSSHMEDVSPSCLVPRETEADATPKANSVKSHGSLDAVRSSAEVLVATVAHSMRCLDSELTTSGREGSTTSDLDNDGIVAEKNKPAHLSNAKVHVEMRSHEVCRDDESIDGKKHLCEQRDMQSTGDQKLNSFSLDDTHQTPQTWSLCAEGNNKKRQAIACAFFAKGWCIKGNSCTFLHQNGSTGGDAGKDTGKINMLSNSQMEGSFQCADTVTSSGPSGLLQEHVSLVHDGKSGKDDKLDDPMFFIHQENLGFRSEMEYQHVKSVINEFQQSPFERDDSREGLMPHPVLSAPVHPLFTNEGLKVYSSPFEELPAHRTLNFQHQQFNSIQSGSEDLHFRNLVRGARGVQETAGRCFIGSEVTGRPSPFDLPTLTSKNESLLSNAPNYRFVSNGLLKYGIHGNASSPSVYDRNGRQSVSPNQSSCLTIFDNISKLDECSSYMANTSSVMPALAYALDRDRSSYYGGISPMSKLECQYKLSRDDIEYSLSSSGSRPRNSPSYYTSSENGKLMHIDASNPSASGGYTTSSYSYSWEPSVPFRSSFLHASARLLSESPCDSIHDSIEPSSKGANGTSQASDFVNGNNFGNTLPEPSSSSNIITGFDDKSFQKETSFHDAKVGKGAYLPRESHDDVAHLAGDEKDIKETKAMKCFRAVLIDFVKELVRPSWQHGNLSKDAHKLVVKKSVGKVLSSMHSHQMPSNSEAIEQFLSLSRPKISKLVQGYVAKYAKAREATK
ncbi:zinc finger CCCH domain-containing protein 36-like isoform X2 [Nymphaea colorata]|uniref:zinc finger CCCH domain-containing protein 36-like isoform X2 n=1 Tax=Nymphaea colorata TaxID=210225 RepID=UPI00129D4D03|nr:zinc finger CCCH domain-containing protein 36-like isoform X2 [Nymphaea colorata]